MPAETPILNFTVPTELPEEPPMPGTPLTERPVSTVAAATYPQVTYKPVSIKVFRDHDLDTGRFKAGNKAASSKRGRMYGGVIDDKSTPQYKRFYREGVRYLRHRRKEFTEMHGYCSSGVCAILRSASVSFAHSLYFQHLASKTKDPDASVELVIKAGKFSEQHQKHELAAYTLCYNECKHRPKLNPYELLKSVMGATEPVEGG